MHIINLRTSTHTHTLIYDSIYQHILHNLPNLHFLHSVLPSHQNFTFTFNTLIVEHLYMPTAFLFFFFILYSNWKKTPWEYNNKNWLIVIFDYVNVCKVAFAFALLFFCLNDVHLKQENHTIIFFRPVYVHIVHIVQM